MSKFPQQWLSAAYLDLSHCSRFDAWKNRVVTSPTYKIRVGRNVPDFGSTARLVVDSAII
jgi:hypothetical protein